MFHRKSNLIYFLFIKYLFSMELLISTIQSIIIQFFVRCIEPVICNMYVKLQHCNLNRYRVMYIFREKANRQMYAYKIKEDIMRANPLLFILTYLIIYHTCSPHAHTLHYKELPHCQPLLWDIGHAVAIFPSRKEFQLHGTSDQITSCSV